LRISEAVHEVGGIFVVDGIAAGNNWVNLNKSGIDIYISAPQKGWSGPSFCGFVMMNERTRKLIDSTKSNSFACNLAKWLEVMETYEKGGFLY